MDFLNSQQLTVLDGYYRRFMKQGDYHWGIGSVGSYVIHVKPKAGNPKQTDIHIQFNATSNMYETSDPNVTINEQDYVLWHLETAVPSAPPYSILGDDFNSRGLEAEDAFSHFFMLTGFYRYVVSGGTGGPQYGSIQVNPAPNPPKPTVVLVTIDDGKPPNPNPLQISAGDTVHWDINTGSGFVIRSLT